MTANRTLPMRARTFIAAVSVSGATMWTPAAALPGPGLARPAASLATSFDVPPPIETVSEVCFKTSSLMRDAVPARGSSRYRRSVPVMST